MCIMRCNSWLKSSNRQVNLLASIANTLGGFLEEQMQKRGLSNRALARAAGISEAAVRNLLKHGIEGETKDPDPRTLNAVAEQLRVDALKLYRLAGYVEPPGPANSVRAEYLADIFDRLPPERQDAVMGVIEALTDEEIAKHNVQKMRKAPSDELVGIDEMFPGLIRLAANHLIAEYKMVDSQDVRLIDPDATVPPGNQWQDLTERTRQRIIALIRYKLSVEYDPTLVDEEWR